jgi:hypothetical protein
VRRDNFHEKERDTPDPDTIHACTRMRDCVTVKLGFDVQRHRGN